MYLENSDVNKWRVNINEVKSEDFQRIIVEEVGLSARRFVLGENTGQFPTDLEAEMWISRQLDKYVLDYFIREPWIARASRSLVCNTGVVNVFLPLHLLIESLDLECGLPVWRR